MATSGLDWTTVPKEHQKEYGQLQYDLTKLKQENEKLLKEVGSQTIVAKNSVNSFIKPKPPKYSGGNAEESNRFIRELKDYFSLLGLKESEWMKNVAFTMDGTARRWFALNNSAWKDFAEFQSAFLSNFVGTESTTSLYLRIFQRQQKSGESFALYAWDVYDLFTYLPTKSTEAEVVERIIDNSHPTIRNHLRALDVSRRTMTHVIQRERDITKDFGSNHSYFKKEATTNATMQINSVQPVTIPENEETKDVAGAPAAVQTITPTPAAKTCFRCKLTGHVARACPTNQGQTCYICFGNDHFMRYCPSRVRAPSGFAYNQGYQPRYQFRAPHTYGYGYQGPGFGFPSHGQAFQGQRFQSQGFQGQRFLNQGFQGQRSQGYGQFQGFRGQQGQSGFRPRFQQSGNSTGQGRTGQTSNGLNTMTDMDLINLSDDDQQYMYQNQQDGTQFPLFN